MEYDRTAEPQFNSANNEGENFGMHDFINGKNVLEFNTRLSWRCHYPPSSTFRLTKRRQYPHPHNGPH